MAKKDTVLAYVQKSEFLRQSARNAARKCFDDVDPHALLTDPQGSSERLAAALIIALAPFMLQTAEAARQYAIALGLPDVGEQQAESVADEVLVQVTDDSVGAFRDQILQGDDKLTQMESEGVGQDTIGKSLASQVGKAAIFAGLLGALNAAAGGLITEIERLVNQEAVSAAPLQPMRWTTVHDGNVCQGDLENSCEPRHGQERSLDEWKQLGLPGAPNLLCTIYSKGASRCRCVLDGSANPQEPSSVNVADAVKAGRDQANQ